jgi:hypothetical protein
MSGWRRRRRRRRGRTASHPKPCNSPFDCAHTVSFRTRTTNPSPACLSLSLAINPILVLVCVRALAAPSAQRRTRDSSLNRTLSFFRAVLLSRARLSDAGPPAPLGGWQGRGWSRRRHLLSGLRGLGARGASGERGGRGARHRCRRRACAVAAAALVVVHVLVVGSSSWPSPSIAPRAV